CSTLAIEDVVPERPGLQAEAPSRPTQPDGFPNLNVPMDPASPQLSEAERQQLVEELTTLRARQAAGPPAAAVSDSEALRELARAHADDVLRKIESVEE